MSKRKKGGPKEGPLYVDLFDYWDDNYPFQIFVGGYGIGKSYSALKGSLERDLRFIYMRRTEKTLKSLATTDKSDKGNPFNQINADIGRDVGIYMDGETVGSIYNRIRDEDDMPKPTGAPIGVAISLSTFAKARGSSLEDYDLIIYDEFCKEAHEAKINEECRALVRAYETINRNREFRGLPPMKLWLISNSEDIYNDILIGLNVVSDMEKMQRRGQEHKYYPERKLGVHLMKSSKEFIERKKQTAIMCLMRGTQFEEVGLYNKFANNDFTLVEYRKLTGYYPIACLGNAYIYRKKGEREYYVCYAKAKCPYYNPKLEYDCIKFRRDVGIALQDPYVHGELIFESYQLKRFILDHIM